MKSLINKYISNEMDKVVIGNVIASFGIKGIALLISLFSLPAYIRYFENQEILGVWFTLISVLIWILSFDFGIGNGLRNNLVGALVRNNKEEIRQTISSAYFVIGVLTVLVISISIITFPYINWNSFLNISEKSVSSDTIFFVVMTVFLTIMLQFYLRLISFILYALQKSALNNLMALITSVTLLIFVLFAPSFDEETNLKMLSVIYLLCVNVPLLVATIIVFTTKLKGYHPSISFLNKQVATGILQLGGVFFWNQIMYTAITGTNLILIAKFIGPSNVVEYQIYFLLFSLVGMVFNLSLAPIWSAITKAFVEKDKAWINKYFKLLNRLVLVAVLCQFLFIPFMQLIVNIWLGNNSISINYTSAMIFALFGSIFVFQTVLSTFACGIGKMKLQAYFYTIGAIVKFILVYFGTKLYDDWIIIVISDIIILAPYCIFQMISLNKQFK